MVLFNILDTITEKLNIFKKISKTVSAVQTAVTLLNTECRVIWNKPQKVENEKITKNINLSDSFDIGIVNKEQNEDKQETA